MTTKKDQETKEQEKPVTQADIDRQNRINFATQALSQDGYNRGLGGFLKDTTLSALSGAVSAPQMAVGLLDIPTGGRVGKFLENEDGMIGFRPSEARQIIGDWKSDESKMQMAQYRNADGIMAKAGKVLSNPTMLTDAVTESLPTMLAGGVIGRGVGLAHKGLSALSRGAIGEGVAMAGLSASENRAESENGLLTNKQILGSIGTGVAGSAFGYAGGRLAQRLGVDDIDTAMVRGSLADDTARKLSQEQIDTKLLAGEIGNGTTNRAVGGLKGLVKGAVLEGFTEELPQTMSETAINNWANDRPLMKDMVNNAVLATLSGMAMGSPTGAISGVNNAKNNQALQQRLEQLQQAQQNSIAQEAPANLPTVAGNDGYYDLSDIDTAPTTPIGFHEDVATSSVNEYTYSLPSDMGQTIGTRSMPDDVPDVANDPNYPLPNAQSGQNPQSQEVPTNLPDVANDEQPTPQNTPLADVNPQTFANPQNFDSWLNQDEFVNQYKAQQELKAQKPSERMGLDPNQGSLTRSAVVAVDSGAAQAINPQAGVVAGATQAQAQEGTLARASMQSEPLSAYQTQLQERTAQQEVQAQEAKAVFANAPKLIGKQNYIQNQNERLPTQIMAVEADSLMPSVDNTTNQARDRSRTASRVQVDNIANNLDPMQLTDSTVMGHGSPTISDDGTIIAGNGRTMAIKQAYLQGKADEYRQMLMERADEYGLDKTALAGMKNPVLVKSVGNVGADKLRQLALNSNETGTMTQSAFENARADVERVANINLNQLKADERGDINTSSNRHIINEFVSQFPIEQQNAMRTSNGVLSKQGLERFENALLLSAYGDNPTTQAILESTDEEVRNAVKAIVATAPTVAKTKQGIQDGMTPNDDIASDITEALSMLAKLRREGVKPSDYLAQTNLFGDELSPAGQRLLAFMDANIKSVVKIRQLLYKYYDNLSQENLKQDDMFGKETQTKQSRLNQALQELGHDQFVQPTTATTATAEQARPTSQASQVNERPEKSVSDEQSIGRDDGRVTDSQTAKSKTKQKPKNALDANKDKRVKKAQEKADTQLRQDWGVSMIGNFETTDEFPADFSKENSDPVKEAFLKDSEDYLKIVQYLLEGQGYSLYNGKNGKPEKININHDDVTLIMHKERVNIYVKISASPIFTGEYGEKKHPQNVHILYRVSKGDYSNRLSAGSNNFNQATLTAGELAQKLDELVQREIFRDKVDFTKSINDNAIKNLTNEQAQAVLDMFNGKEVDKSVFGSQTQNNTTLSQANNQTSTPATPQNAEQAQDDGDVVSKLGLDRALFEKLKTHRQQGGDWNEFNLMNDLRKSANTEKVTAEYKKNYNKEPRKIDLMAFLTQQIKNAIDNPSQTTDNPEASSQQQEQQNAITNRAQSPSDRILADTPSDSVATDDTRETASLHSKSDEPSARRDTNQSTNGDDSQRSTGVLSDGAKTGVSERVETQKNNQSSADVDDGIATPAKQEQTTTQALDNALSTTNAPTFALSDEMVQTGSVKQKLETNIAIIELLQALKADNRQPTNDEKALMAKYTGFGGLTDAFPDSQGNYKKGFETLGEKLKNLLSRDEYDNARASSTSAFFTPPNVINAMWDIAQRLGYNGGVVLEPSAGIGAFIGHAPKNLPQNIIGAEIDPTTHAITGYLYPHANIFNQGYETLSLPDNSVDLAIGNPPYGGVRLNFKDKPHLSGKTIANSFMQGTLEQVKPSGLSVMVVSSSFMDSTDASTRKAMAQLGELVGAVRLPNTTFDEAGTAVVADILVFKKHDEATLQAYKDGTNNTYPSWVQSGKRQNDDGTEVNFNPYFDDKIAGEFEFGTGEGGRAVYTVKETGGIEKALDSFVKSFEKVKSTRTVKEIQTEIDTANKAMIESLTLHSNGQSEGYIGRENGVLVQVIERTDGNATSLTKRPLLPSSVWSDSYSQDLDGRWYRLEDVKDKNGKAIKEKDKDGKTLRTNKKQKVYYDEKDISPQSKLGDRGMNVISRALEIQGLIENQLRLEQGGASDTDIENNRKELNRAYDEFVKKFGYLNNANNAKYIDKLPKANFILALEIGYKKEVAIGTGKNKEINEPEKAGKADILSKRVLEPKAQKTKADSPQDALSLSLAYRGYVDLDLMQDLTGQTKEQLTNTLSKTGELFFDPQSESWVIKDEYLSGNIRQKLNTAKEHNLTQNVTKLEKVLPKDVEIENISIRLGMNWLPEQIYGDFAKQLLGNPNAYVEYEPITHTYSVVGSASHTAINEFGAGGKNPEWILDKILNNKQIRVTRTVDKQTILMVDETAEANDMAKTIKGEFENFIYSHPDIANIAKLYNEKHNAVVGRKYDGSHLELSGKVPDNVIKLRTHQKNAVWRGVTTNAVLYDHAVGSGKTFTGIARAMERKRLGLSKKPVLVVPNHMVGQFAQDIYRLYPSANVLAAGTKDFAKRNRKRLFGQIATGDYDIIVLPHSSFEFMKLSADRQKIMLEQERDKIMNAIRAMKAEQGKRESVKQLEQAKKNLDTKLEKLAKTKRHDSEFSFEQMGIDDITVDEAHEFKNLFFTTKMQGVKGLGNPAGSNKAMDLWLKTQYLHQTNGSVAFMTGTPISNSAAEMHAMMRYLMPDTLAEMGLDNFDAWANTYAENVAKFEATESGQLKLATRFAREWQNMGSLMNLWQTATDSVTNEDIKATYKAETGQEFPLPQVDGGTRKSVVVKPTAQQEQILQMILAGFAKIEAKELDKEEADKLRLQLMDLATKNALDPRTINPSLDAGGKIGAVVDNVVDTYHKWSDDKGTQIIFLDRSIPKSRGDDKKIAEYEALLQRRENAIQTDNDEELLKANDLLDKYDENEMAELITAKNGGFTAYDEIKKGLIARGIPADEIAFIQEAESDDDKTALFDQVNAGRVRVIIGSSQRMGAGTNIQKRLVALHHVDAPWKPSDIEQREGRIIRQGNELYEKYGHDNFTVSINAYVTEKTADAKRWDTMSAKLGTINAIRHYNGEHTLDFQEDDDNSSFQEIAALATGNPLMRERVELTAQKEQLDRAKLNHQKRDAGNRTKLTQAQKNANALPKQIEAYTKAKAQYDELLPQAQAQFDKTGITIDDKRFTDRKSANDYINDKAKQATDNGKKASYVIDGESVASLSGATEKIRQSQIAKKGTTPTLITTDGKTSAIVSEAVTDKVINQVNKHNNETAIAQIMGFNVLSYDTGSNTLLTLETQDGYEIANTTLDHFATREKVENAFGRLVGSLGQNVNNSLQNVQNQLKIANDTIEQLQDKTGLPFDKEQELKDVSDRLNDVQAQLSDDDSENQFKDDAKFADLKALLGSRTLQNGQSATPFVPTANYETGNKASANQALSQADFDELRTIQKDMLSVLDSLPESDPKKDQYTNEVYALDRSDEQPAKDARNKLMKDIATYELVVRKAGELSDGLGALGYTVKADKVEQTDDSYTTNITATKDDRVLDIRINRMINEHRANDPTRNGVFVNDNGLNYSFSINELAISQGIDNYHEYKTNGKHFGDNRPQLTYAKGTTWQEQMRTELARLFDDDPRLSGFVEMANNPKLASSYKNEIRLALTHYADRQAEKGNALLPHEVESGIANRRHERQVKADRPYFGKDRPKFDIGEKAKDTKQEIAGQLARLFDDDPKLSEFTDEANKATSPLKLAMILNAIKDHVSRMVMDGKALFMGEVLQRQNADYHAGKLKFSKQGGRYGTTAQDVLDVLNNRFGKDTIKKLLNNDSLKIISLAEAKAQFGNIPDDVDGFYTDGTAYLIHDNIHTDMIVPTFLHELGGHGGLQTLMSERAYQSLLNEFHDMVARGDETAKQAKALADRHSRTQAEADSEYLAYMITLAGRNNSSKAKSLMNRVIMAVKTFLKNTFGISLALTPNDILALSEKMVRDRANGQVGNGIDDVWYSKPTPQTEIDDVQKIYKNTDEWLKAPNGEPTRLTKKQWLQVRTPSFKAWFGDWENDPDNASKVLDENGEPLVVYHGTKRTNRFYAFENNSHGLHFGTKEQAKARNSGRLIQAFLNIRNIEWVEDQGVHWSFDVKYAPQRGIDGFIYENEVEGSGDSFVAFYPNQIKSATDNIGTFDSNDDIRFSRMADMADFYDKNQDKAKEVLGKLGGVVNDFINNPKSFVKSAKQGVGGKAQDHLGKFLQFLGRRQLVDLFAKKLDGLKAYSDRVAQMDADSNENAFRADKLAVKWGKLKDEQALAELMHDVTQKGIDPSRSYQTGDKAQYQRLKRAYDKLTDDAKAVYEQARDDYQDYYKNLHEAMTGRIKRNAKLSNERKQTLLDELDKQYQATQKVFFPLTRFGDYVVVVKDTDGNVVNVARAETKAKADEIRRGLIRDNPNHQVGQVVLGRDMDIRELGGVQALASEFLTDELDLGDELHQAYLNSLLDRQFANNNVELKGTKGFSTNARRAYAHHMSRGGYHIAKLRHTDRLRTELDRMQKHIDENVDNPDYDHVTMQRVVDEMEKRHSLLLDPPSSPVSTMATSLGFMWYMGLSPASALVNISQTFLVALPMMSAKFGSVKSAKMLGEISKILATNKNDLTEVLTGDELKMFKKAVNMGVIDMTQAHDLAGIANGEDSRVSQAIQPVMKVASFMFHQAEKYNRQVTYLASYRLGIEKGLSPEQAMEQAIQLTYDGHFDYASSNRPRFMQGNWQRVLFLFKQYSQNMVYTLTRQTYQAVKGETAEQKREARKILGGILAGHALMAGALGLPWVITMPFLAMFSALGGDDDDELTDNETEFRNALASVVGKDLAEVIAKGVPRAFGADLSTRVALNDLIIPRTQDGLEGQRQGENVLAAAAGPFFAIPISMLKGMGQIGQGQTLQGVENMIPKALRDPLKAYRYATEGNVDKSGIEIVERENVGISDIAQQAIGFRSGKFAKAQEVKSAIYQADKQLTAIRSDLVRQYALAKRNGDDEQMDRIWEEIKHFNVKHPSVKITKPALMQSIRQRQRRIDNAKDGIYLSKNREYLREYGAFGVGG
ncbi:PLxRFG domain-containing protein [Moraxella sp. K127]|uniref:PLxRFG domain-containing protein n=1 Tax=Moraxella sp. K127 TaxID=2780079 RepID=UPI001882387F|nr:PLxRFG domain-containing protein [Moraxella sp. K127]MBE9589974.1 PLxRFG domain-containing protein [Moraxella sp. K127]